MVMQWAHCIELCTYYQTSCSHVQQACARGGIMGMHML